MGAKIRFRERGTVSFARDFERSPVHIKDRPTGRTDSGQDRRKEIKERFVHRRTGRVARAAGACSGGWGPAPPVGWHPRGRKKTVCSAALVRPFSPNVRNRPRARRPPLVDGAASARKRRREPLGVLGLLRGLGPSLGTRARVPHHPWCLRRGRVRSPVHHEVLLMGNDVENGALTILDGLTADEEAAVRDEENEELHARFAAIARRNRPRLERMITAGRRRLRGDLTRRQLDEAEQALRQRHGVV